MPDQEFMGAAAVIVAAGQLIGVDEGYMGTVVILTWSNNPPHGKPDK